MFVLVAAVLLLIVAPVLLFVMGRLIQAATMKRRAVRIRAGATPVVQ